ncbi:glucans biosynthesis glucosyltransferase MdoH [Polynucleobacter brandtiae]|nr:glucans biosynthesis glucosyltransferase MdoH [Polynucleobacter brandtiae]
MSINLPTKHNVRVRRSIFAGLTLCTCILMLWLIYEALTPQTPLMLHIALLVLVGVTLPWMVIGFWNAIIGLLLCQLSSNPVAHILPAEMLKQNSQDGQTVTASTAILLCIRNETPERLVRNLDAMLQGLSASVLNTDNAVSKHFHIYILSDTDDLSIAAQERECFLAIAQRWEKQFSVIYRCRTDNTAYKAGNIADFCKRWGGQHEFALTLDADSFMTASAIVRLVRMMQSNPRLGILQGLVVGLPSTSAFTRLFQFGMRLGMRSYTMGSAWWQADCGPYWGHNALIRLAPFIAHCDLPQLPLRSGASRPILSHDLIEAVLMRRAGFEVRIYPQEDESWEENPPTLTEYIRRDLRWCEGNLQYVQLLTLPKLTLLSRLQLLLAIFMFLGSPAWIALMVICTVAISISTSPSTFINAGPMTSLLSIALVMWYLPKIAGALDVLLRKQERQRFGGGYRFSLSLILEVLFALLMTPITWLNHSLFMVGLILGKKQGWMAQSRDDHSIHLLEAIRQFWPHTLLGVTLSVMLYKTYPQALAYGLLFFSGLILAIPLAVLSSQPWLGRFMLRRHLLSLPEEIMPPTVLLVLDLPALKTA